jgi:hypothetical protein
MAPLENKHDCNTVELSFALRSDSGHGTGALRLPLDALASSLARLALYGKPVCNLIDLAFDSGPLDRLIVVATPKRHCVAPKRNDDITFGNAVVAPYTNIGRLGGDHDLAATRLKWSRPSQSR